jgi:hypothetical protein
VVSSLFSVKAAHWRDGIRRTELGARGKERTARQRRVIRVKGSASRGGGIEHENEHEHEHEHEEGGEEGAGDTPASTGTQLSSIGRIPTRRGIE